MTPADMAALRALAKNAITSHGEQAFMDAYIAAANPQAVLSLLDEVERLREALKGLLSRDQINTCQHEETHRGGFLWEICDSCGAKWADDEGGKPEWKDPPEWDAARAALDPRA